MTPQEWVPIVSALALASWVVVILLERDHVRRVDAMPDAVREASLVAVIAACVGGTVASLGFTEAISSDVSAAAAIAWRAAVLACGVYAIIGSASDGRAD